MKLVLAIDQAGVDVGLYRRNWRGWARVRHAWLGWREGRAQETFAEKFQATLRPLLLEWAVPPQTPCLITPSSDIGGVVESAYSEVKPEDWLELSEKLLASRLPYSVKELVHCHRLVGLKTQGKLQKARLLVYWLPRAWLADCRAVLARLGMRLVEIYPRPRLFENLTGLGNSGGICIEQSGTALALYAIDGERATTAKLTVELAPPSHLQPLTLALQGLGGERAGVYGFGLSPECEQAVRERSGHYHPTEMVRPLSDALFRQWLTGERGIWLAPERESINAKITPWAIGFAVVGLGVFASMSWYERKLNGQLKTVEDNKASIESNHRRVAAKQRELFHIQDQLGRVERFDQLASRSPLNTLALVSEHLPAEAWLTAYTFKDKTVTIEGSGLDNARLIAALEKTPLAAKPYVPPPPPKPAAKPAAAVPPGAATAPELIVSPPAAKAPPALPQPATTQPVAAQPAVASTSPQTPAATAKPSPRFLLQIDEKPTKPAPEKTGKTR
ncbi:hypothetical protein [Chitinimonas lacunae]|uniref:Uncharacterized protein n=1 Tax=Chitinimonas lacunae TaxID=1963018 RepID=A0ABV8MWS3_9NEIS